MHHREWAVLLLAGVWAQSAIAQQLSTTHFWISPSDSKPPGSVAPLRVEDVPFVSVQPGNLKSFYIWARPEGDINLMNWSLNVVSTNPEVIRLKASHVMPYNVPLGTVGRDGMMKNVHRWELVGEPAAEDILTGTATPEVIKSIQGYSVLGIGQTVGIGIGSANTLNYAATDTESYQGAWRLARIDYEVAPNAVSGASSNIFLQIGYQGLAHCAGPDAFTCTSSSSQDSAAIFGAKSDPPLRAAYDGERPELSQRELNSASADAIFSIGASSSAGDFDGNGIYDGRDFLIWQRNPVIGSLVDWQRHFGRASGVNSLSVPEPACLSRLTLLTSLAFLRRSRRGWHPG